VTTREDVLVTASGPSRFPPSHSYDIVPDSFSSICVAEPTKAPVSEEGSGSLASSSVVMPHAAPSNPTVPIPSHDESTTAPLLSDASSMSLIDVLSDDDDDDDDSEVYEDSRSQFASTPGNNQVLSPDVEYVVLSDGSDDL
jgi:hypothetical protein